MNMMSIAVGGVLFVLMTGFLGASGAVAAYEPIANLRVVHRAKRISAEEALLTFRIVEAVGRGSRLGCLVNQNLERDQRLLDPQLAASDKSRYANSVGPAACKEIKSTLPMNR